MSKSLLFITTTISLLFLSTSAFAAEVTTEQIHTSKYFPKGTIVVEEGTGTEYMGYTEEQFKELLALDQSLQYYMKEVNTMSQRLDLAIEKNEKVTVLVSLTEKQRDVYKADSERYYNKWKDENKRRHEAENSNIFGDTLFTIFVTTTVVETVLLFFLLQGDALDKL